MRKELKVSDSFYKKLKDNKNIKNAFEKQFIYQNTEYVLKEYGGKKDDKHILFANEIGPQYQG
tara:strand:- start:1077 stop:1265 length:189 start_codon:yes stop_codon:yes gene_type:complete